MNDANTGKNLGKCFQVVSQVYEEIDALIVALQGQIDDYLTENELCEQDAKWNKQPKSPDGYNGRFYSNYLCSRKLEDNWHLGFQISLICEAVNQDENAEPLLHVFKWEMVEGVNVPDLSYFSKGYPLELGAELRGDSLIVWYDEASSDNYQWFFSLRLAALTNKESLNEHIIKPIENLKDVKLANYKDELLNPWEGLVSYNKKKDGSWIASPKCRKR